MIATTHDRPELVAAVAATVAAVALFVLSFALLHVGFYEHEQIRDTPVYERYADAMKDRHVPYRDFRVEYPPLALPVFLVPALPGDDYRTWFELLMALFGCVTVVCFAVAARVLRLGFGSLVFVALAPLAIGSVVLSRFDLWPAALLAGSVAAALSNRVRLAHIALGAAIAAKVYGAVLLPLTVAYAWRRHGRREGLLCLALTLGVVALVYLPFVAVAPEGTLRSVGRQLSRPLQIESLGAAVLHVAHQAFGAGIEMHSSHGSQNLVGTTATVLAVLVTIVQVAVLAWLWVRFARAAPTPPALAAFAAAAVVAFVALGKVLSPQFLIWLVPLVPLARSWTANALLAASLVLTQLWFPYRYWDLAREFDAVASWLVVARDATLVALLVVLVRVATERAREPFRTA